MNQARGQCPFSVTQPSGVTVHTAVAQMSLVWTVSMQHTEGRLLLVNYSWLVRTTGKGGGTSGTRGDKVRQASLEASGAFVSFIWGFLQRPAAGFLGMKYYLPNCLNLLSRSV